MPPLFDHLDFVRSFLSLSPLGLMTDIDGTISQIAPTPGEAQISPLCHHYLDLLSKRLKPVAVISGRPVTKMRDMLKIEDLIYIGNHGFERWIEGKVKLCNDVAQYPALIEATLQDLKPLLDTKGLLFENKGVTASIHYRLCQDQEATKKQILTALANSSKAKDLQIRQGRMSIELLPPVKVSKGSAALDLVREYQLRAAIYLGDDLTDLDAFRAIHGAKAPDFDGICLGVIGKETAPLLEKEADFTLNGVSEVEHFLEWLTKVIGS